MKSLFQLIILSAVALASPILHAGNLKVTILPSQAVSAGAQWRVDGGVWRNSATTFKVSNGNHTVEYKAVAGWTAPATTTVNVVNSGTNITGTYVVIPPPTLSITLNPSSGYWQVDGGIWRASGTTVTGLSPGNHTIVYSGIASHLTPPSETITLTNGQNAVLTRNYTPAGQIFVMLSPSTGQWRIDGGAWRATHTSSGLISAGPHTLEYSPIAGYVPPQTETVTVVGGQSQTLSRFHTQEYALTVNLSPAVGRWRINGGGWNNSGVRVGMLVNAIYSLEYEAAAGYIAPPAENIVLSAHETTITRNYTIPPVPGSLTVNIIPAAGQWRLSSPPNSPWINSGSTVSGLNPGYHTVQLSSIAGYFDAPNYAVMIAEGENSTVTYERVPHSSVTITLVPGVGQWRISGGELVSAWQPSGASVTTMHGGSYTVEYSAVSGMTAPPSETFQLISGENKNLVRDYAGPASLTVNLAPSSGQWRLDSGAWQMSGAVQFNISPGPHTIEYAPLAGFIAPTTETLWFRENKSQNINRNYLDSATSYLKVQAVPAYLNEVAGANWRVDGGPWNPVGKPIAVSSGTHTLEFQPTAGLDVPPAETVTVVDGEVTTAEVTFYLTHRLRFFLHSNLVGNVITEDLRARLVQYASDIQTIFHRETLRRFTFDPLTDISIVEASPFSNNTPVPAPEIGFEVWAYADSANGSIFGSHGGEASGDNSGAGGATDMHWTQIYDPSTLLPDTEDLQDYWTQINNTVHEFQHTFGAGVGEYYTVARVNDHTGIEPLASIAFSNPSDVFWNAHQGFWGDPLLISAWSNDRLGNPTSLSALREAVKFSATSRAVINGCYRNADSPHTFRTTLPDLKRIQVKVVDETTGLPISAATLRIWNRPRHNETDGLPGEELSVIANPQGGFEFAWTSRAWWEGLNSFENAKLLKAFAPGYESKAQWEWLYDAQLVRTFDQLDVWEIVISLTPTP